MKPRTLEEVYEQGLVTATWPPSSTASAPACDCGRGSIEFLDVSGRTALRFIQLGDRYYGGTTHDEPELFFGPHVWLELAGMFDLIAKLAVREKFPIRWEISRSVPAFDRLVIDRHMPADRLATILGCATGQVRDHFGLVVKIA